MPFLNICEDPLVKTLRDVFGANIVRVPEERIQPLSVVANKEGRSIFRGTLAPLVLGEPELSFHETDIFTSTMPDISGKRSRKVRLELGLQILEGFLQGFGVPTAGISLKFSGASEVSFSFRSVRRSYIDNNWLGRVLTNRLVDKKNPAAAIFFNDDPFAFLVIDSIITSSDFSISVDRTHDQSFTLDVPAIQNIVSQVNTGIEVSTSSGYDLIFQGQKHLSFAFSCVRLYLDARGRITSMPPEFDIVLGRNMLPSSSAEELLYSPDQVLLNDKASLLSWDE